MAFKRGRHVCVDEVPAGGPTLTWMPAPGGGAGRHVWPRQAGRLRPAQARHRAAHPRDPLAARGPSVLLGHQHGSGPAQRAPVL